MTERERIYRMDPERERLAMNPPTGRRKGQRDTKPRQVTAVLLASAARALALVTSEGRSRGRMAMSSERRAEVARKAAEARWGRTA